MAATRREFEATARMVKKLPVKQRETVAGMFAKQFAVSNPRFDKKKFFTACGV